MQNIFEGNNRPRLVENWFDAPSAYLGPNVAGQENFAYKYNKYMMKAKGAPIVPPGANPILWVIIFCEKSGMRWGNGNFLKKRFYFGNTWSQSERKLIAELFGIPRVVERVQAISWNSNIDDHMHFQYWAGTNNLIKWKKDGTL